MRKRIIPLVLLIFVPIVSACGTTRVDPSHDVARLTSQLEEIERLVSTEGPRDFPAAYVRHFTDDATLLTAQGSVIQGRANVLAFYERVAANVTSIQVEHPEAPTIVIDGSLAVRWYTGVTRAVYAGQDTMSIVSTRYLDVLQRQPDGSWKIRWHVWNRN